MFQRNLQTPPARHPSRSAASHQSSVPENMKLNGVRHGGIRNQFTNESTMPTFVGMQSMHLNRSPKFSDVSSAQSLTFSNTSKGPDDCVIMTLMPYTARTKHTAQNHTLIMTPHPPLSSQPSPSHCQKHARPSFSCPSLTRFLPELKQANHHLLLGLGCQSRPCRLTPY